MMITENSYKRLPEKVWIGIKVKLLVDLLTGGGVEFKKGEILSITGKQAGFKLMAPDGRTVKHVCCSLVELIEI